MSKQKKEYNNIFAKLIEYHNAEIVPWIKKIDDRTYGTIKVSRRRILLMRNKLENDSVVHINKDSLIEYIIFNKPILDFLDRTELDNCMSLINTTNFSSANYLMGASFLYNLIEEKKKELKKLHDDKQLANDTQENT